jgi:hypothetical protein
MMGGALRSTFDVGARLHPKTAVTMQAESSARMAHNHGFNLFRFE